MIVGRKWMRKVILTRGVVGKNKKLQKLSGDFFFASKYWLRMNEGQGRQRVEG